MDWSSAVESPVADARARRAARAAVAQALQHTALDWAALDACPPWLAAPAEARELLCAHAGAWWMAAALRACIDGKRLAQVCDVVGAARLNALRDAPATARAAALEQAPQPLLPPADEMPRHLVACGRALMAWSVPDAVRAPVLVHLGWAADPRASAAFADYAAWARHALQAALDDAALPTAAEAGSDAEPALAEDDTMDNY